MRVVSLLPAATEIVAALGDQSLLVGISHECDYPPSVLHLPRVTTTPIDIRAPGAVIDAEVRRLYQAGQPVIAIDEPALRQLAPDVIITQDLCQICAVSDGQVHRLAGGLHPEPRVLSLSAQNLAGVWQDIRAIGAVLQLGDQAEELVLGLQSRLRKLEAERSAHSPGSSASNGSILFTWPDTGSPSWLPPLEDWMSAQLRAAAQSEPNGPT